MSVPPTPHTDTAVSDGAWDAGTHVGRLSNGAGQATYEKVYAWRDPAKDADTKDAYSLPHHEVSTDGTPGPANANGVRAALSRVSQVKAMPESDQAQVNANLNKHLAKANGESKSLEFEDVGPRAALRVQTDARVWAINPNVLAALCDLDGTLIAAQMAAELEARQQQSSGASGGGDIAVVSLQGVLMPAAGGLFALLFGGGGLDTFQSQLAAAAADSDVQAIVMNVDSPGGVVDQIPETAQQIRDVRAVKPVVAVANTQADSAAYWLASQADEIVVTPSGQLGSIGVYQMHRDMSEAHAMRGIAPTLISAGKYKVEGNPYEPLGADAKASMQADVDDYYGMFSADVAKGRGVTQAAVKSGFGEGRSLHARQAVDAGLADRVDTLQGTVRRLASPRGRAALSDRRAAEDVRRVAEDVEVVPVTYTPEERNRLLAVLAD